MEYLIKDHWNALWINHNKNSNYKKENLNKYALNFILFYLLGFIIFIVKH